MPLPGPPRPVIGPELAELDTDLATNEINDLWRHFVRARESSLDPEEPQQHSEPQTSSPGLVRHQRQLVRRERPSPNQILRPIADASTKRSPIT